jgi:hypothetical protein
LPGRRSRIETDIEPSQRSPSIQTLTPVTLTVTPVLSYPDEVLSIDPQGGVLNGAVEGTVTTYEATSALGGRCGKAQTGAPVE